MFLLYSFVFLFGLAVGSFLNAVIYRLPFDSAQGKSALKGRSCCPHCKHLLAWKDLIPLASFAMLGGKCRYCKARISIQYPLVEICTACIFLLIFNFEFLIFNEFSNFLIFETFYLFVIASLLIVLFVYDLKHYILPDRILFPAIGIAVAYQLSVWVIKNWDLIKNLKLEIGNFAPLASATMAAFGAASFFLAIFLISRGKAMGFGDVKLALFMGLFLGWPNILVALFFAFFSGAVVGLSLIFLKRKTMKSEVPFGPFLIAGTFGALFWGKQAVDYYINLLVI